MTIRCRSHFTTSDSLLPRNAHSSPSKGSIGGPYNPFKTYHSSGNGQKRLGNEGTKHFPCILPSINTIFKCLENIEATKMHSILMLMLQNHVSVQILATFLNTPFFFSFAYVLGAISSNDFKVFSPFQCCCLNLPLSALFVLQKHGAAGSWSLTSETALDSGTRAAICPWVGINCATHVAAARKRHPSQWRQRRVPQRPMARQMTGRYSSSLLLCDVCSCVSISYI